MANQSWNPNWLHFWVHANNIIFYLQITTRSPQISNNLSTCLNKLQFNYLISFRVDLFSQMKKSIYFMCINFRESLVFTFGKLQMFK